MINIFCIWQSMGFIFRTSIFRHLAEKQIFFSNAAKKFVIWLLKYFFVKRQDYFRQKAALPPSHLQE